MAKVVGMMSMSLDGYVADANDGLTEVFDWYFSSGDVEVSTASATAGRTYHVSAPSADYLRGMMAEVGAVLIGRRTFENAPGGCRIDAVFRQVQKRSHREERRRERLQPHAFGDRREHPRPRL